MPNVPSMPSLSMPTGPLIENPSGGPGNSTSGDSIGDQGAANAAAEAAAGALADLGSLLDCLGGLTGLTDLTRLPALPLISSTRALATFFVRLIQIIGGHLKLTGRGLGGRGYKQCISAC